MKTKKNSPARRDPTFRCPCGCSYCIEGDAPDTYLCHDCCEVFTQKPGESRGHFEDDHVEAS